MYSPASTKGIPQKAKKNGAPATSTLVSQKSANPPQIRLKGMNSTSDARNTIPWRGCPYQRSFSREPSCWRIIELGSDCMHHYLVCLLLRGAGHYISVQRSAHGDLESRGSPIVRNS